MTLGLPAMFLVFFLATSAQPSIMKLYVGAVLLAVAGLYLPNIFIAAKRDRRQRELLNGFPDALDLMLRSEEHTSELQSLMRISYAVFCLKKKKIHKQSTLNLQPLIHPTTTSRNTINTYTRTHTSISNS